MIEFTKAFKTSDGQTHGTIVEAQEHELAQLLSPLIDDAMPAIRGKVVSLLIEQSDKVVDILTTTANSKPRARKLHGGSKNRKSAAAVNRELQDMKQ